MRLGKAICQLSKDERDPWDFLTFVVVSVCTFCAGAVVGCQLVMWGMR